MNEKEQRKAYPIFVCSGKKHKNSSLLQLSFGCFLHKMNLLLYGCIFFLFHCQCTYSLPIDQQSWPDGLLSSRENKFPRVAVCVSGQVTRWQPKHLFNGLLLTNPQFFFYLFYNLQVPPNSTQNIYSTDPQYNFEISPMTHYDLSEAAQYIQSLYIAVHNVHLASMRFARPYTEDYWKTRFHHQPLDRIRDHVHIQTSILNMYAHQPACIQQILAFEASNNWQFHYIVNTREDVYFFKSLDLTYLIKQIKHPHNDPASALFPHLSSNHTSLCDIPFKGCLNFWGFNMRFYVLRRNVGVKYLADRFIFYEKLYRMNRTIKNPEKFEYVQAFQYGMRGCKVSVDDMPVTAVRHVRNFDFCMIFLEYFNCIPTGYEKFVRSKSCPTIMRGLEYEKKIKEKKMGYAEKGNAF